MQVFETGGRRFSLSPRERVRVRGRRAFENQGRSRTATEFLKPL
jgi:hypothetical protein